MPSTSITTDSPPHDHAPPGADVIACHLESPVDISLQTRVIRGEKGLTEILGTWRQLADEASDPNPFYGPALFRPLTRLLRPESWRVVTMWAGGQGTSSNRLVGFFPILERRLSRGAPFRCLSLLQHDYTFLTTPLIAPSFENSCIRTFFKHVRDEEPISLVEFPILNTDGPVHAALQREIARRNVSTHCFDDYSRALLRRSTPTADEYIQEASGGHTLRELRRVWRRLGELGDIEFRRMSREQADLWANWFLELESRGWKGQEGTAFNQREPDRDFFRELVKTGATDGTVEMLGLFLKGEPIAMKCNLLAGHGSYAFKIAFDELLSKYSPGVQLELEMIRQFWSTSTTQWMDSCATPQHFMINRLWLQRRPMQHLLVSAGGTQANLAIATLPWLRSLRQWSARWSVGAKTSLPANDATSPDKRE